MNEIEDLRIQVLRQSLELERERSKMSRRQFAMSLGISVPFYWRWLKGKQQLGKNALLKIQRKYPELVGPELIEAAQDRGRPFKEQQ